VNKLTLIYFCANIFICPNNTQEQHMLLASHWKILEILFEEAGWMSGLEIVRSSVGQIKHGSVYVRLSELGDLGYIESRRETAEEWKSRNTQNEFLLLKFKITDQGISEWNLRNFSQLTLVPIPLSISVR